MIQFKRKKIKSPSTEILEKFLIELKGKQSSVNALLNKSSSVNHCQTLWNLTLSEEKRSGYALYPPIA